MGILQIVMVVVALIAVAVLVFALRGGRETESEIAERLDTYIGDEVAEPSDADIEEQAKRLSKLTEGLNRVIERRSLGAGIATRLAHALAGGCATEFSAPDNQRIVP